MPGSQNATGPPPLESVPLSVQPVSEPTSPPAQSRISSVHVPAGAVIELKAASNHVPFAHMPVPVFGYRLYVPPLMLVAP